MEQVETGQRQSVREILSPNEAARLIGRSRTLVLALIAEGAIPHLVVNGRTYIKRADLIRDHFLTRA
jgi:excisionase family DNA binding protein